jgi:hypothetical protein
LAVELPKHSPSIDLFLSKTKNIERKIKIN